MSQLNNPRNTNPAANAQALKAANARGKNRMSGAPTTSTQRRVAASKIVIVNNKEDFDKVIDDAGNKIVLIEFYAEWCGPCKLIGPKLEEWANLYDKKAIIVRVDVDDLEDLALDYGVESMPTFIFLKNKKKMDTIVGTKASDEVKKLLEKHCGLSIAPEPSKPAPTTAATAAPPSATARPSTASTTKKPPAPTKEKK